MYKTNKTKLCSHVSKVHEVYRISWIILVLVTVVLNENKIQINIT